MPKEYVNELVMLIGETIKEIHIQDTERPEDVMFVLESGEKYYMRHDQDCCEYVYLEDVSGDWYDLIGSKLVMAEEVVREFDYEKDTSPEDYEPESATWTFYKFATEKGYVTLRWYGSSNGYYAERVCITSVTENFSINSLYRYDAISRERVEHGVKVYKSSAAHRFH